MSSMNIPFHLQQKDVSIEAIHFFKRGELTVISNSLNLPVNESSFVVRFAS